MLIDIWKNIDTDAISFVGESVDDWLFQRTLKDKSFGLDPRG
jgi:hypothetical protein